jgi:hypothetical protein
MKVQKTNNSKIYWKGVSLRHEISSDSRISVECHDCNYNSRDISHLNIKNKFLYNELEISGDAKIREEK